MDQIWLTWLFLQMKYADWPGLGHKMALSWEVRLNPWVQEKCGKVFPKAPNRRVSTKVEVGVDEEMHWRPAKTRDIH